MYSKEELHKLFIELYQQKQNFITLKEVGSALGVSGETVRYYINQVNAYEDCPDVFRGIQKSLHQFDTIDIESAYWIGYLMADGCLTTNSKNKNVFRVMLECKTEDKEILEKFCLFFGNTSKSYFYWAQRG